ncbi:MAG: hypothetical protein E6K60_06015 [Nitrospirae bacterium]|nr:MAG: hypothetical protein E6K60_06015 [Nitrospirota bacterium]
MAALASVVPPASAHHEAIFGPQSSLLYSLDRFVSVQVFSRQTGPSTQKTQETTGVIAAGANPLKGVPLTVTAIAPASLINQLDAGSSRAGLEDMIIGARYRYDLSNLIDKWNRDGNFLLGVAGIEIPSGSIDHKSWDGPVDYLGGALGSLEKGAWSGIAYTYYRRNSPDKTDSKRGDNIFVGGGLAYTPGEDVTTGKLISYQVGWSYETYLRNRVAGAGDPNTGGKELLVHPTLVYSPGHGVVFFGLVSVPVWRDFKDPVEQDRFRLGTGVIYAW